MTKGFDETAVQKLGDFVEDLFNWKKPIKDLTYLSSVAKDAVERFRTNYDAALGTAQSFKVNLHFATKSQTDPNTKVLARSKNVTAHIRRQATNAVADFQFWKAARLLQSARATPQIDLLIPLAQHFSTDDDSLVGLVTLTNFAQLLTNSDKSLRTSILEPNVRDYQGKGNKVNADIRATLLEVDPKEDFWWLNNGVTILAQACSVSGNKLKITKPEVVNGLQTSHEVFNAFSGGATKGGERKILLRVITPKEEKSRNNIIKATNSQTTVSPVSLRATDKIHFDIEDRLKLYDAFYDRRKGESKRLKRPIAKIVSIRELAQSVMATLLQRPADARARPQNLLNEDSSYNQLFNGAYSTDVYAASILLDRQIDAHLAASTLTKDHKRDVRYYALMLVMARLAKKAVPSPAEVAGTIAICAAPVDKALLASAVEDALKEYKKLGGTDKVAKGATLTKKLVAKLAKEFPGQAVKNPPKPKKLTKI